MTVSANVELRWLDFETRIGLSVELNGNQLQVTSSLLQGGSVSWKSKKQSFVTTSTTKAKYVALSTAALECTQLRRMTAFAGSQNVISAVPINIENQAAIKIAKNDENGNRTKHIIIKNHLIQNLLEDKKVINNTVAVKI